MNEESCFLTQAKDIYFPKRPHWLWGSPSVQLSGYHRWYFCR